MRRLFLLVFLAAGLGSLMATIACSLIPDTFGPGVAFGSLQFMLRLSAIAMVFTVPGATLLVGLQGRLLERNLPGWVIGPSLLVFGGVAGGLVFLVGNIEPMWIGALYGASTAVVLLLVERLPGLSPAAIR